MVGVIGCSRDSMESRWCITRCCALTRGLPYKAGDEITTPVNSVQTLLQVLESFCRIRDTYSRTHVVSLCNISQGVLCGKTALHDMWSCGQSDVGAKTLVRTGWAQVGHTAVRNPSVVSGRTLWWLKKKPRARALSWGQLHESLSDEHGYGSRGALSFWRVHVHLLLNACRTALQAGIPWLDPQFKLGLRRPWEKLAWDVLCMMERSLVYVFPSTWWTSAGWFVKASDDVKPVLSIEMMQRLQRQVLAHEASRDI